MTAGDEAPHRRIHRQGPFVDLGMDRVFDAVDRLVADLLEDAVRKSDMAFLSSSIGRESLWYFGLDPMVVIDALGRRDRRK